MTIDCGREALRLELVAAELELAGTPLLETGKRVRLVRQIRELGVELEDLDRAIARRRSEVTA